MKTYVVISSTSCSIWVDIQQSEYSALNRYVIRATFAALPLSLCKILRVIHTHWVWKRIYHVSFENMVHNLMTWQLRTVHQQLEHELQPRIHFASSRLAFAFFATSLRIHIVRHDSDVWGVQNQCDEFVYFFFVIFCVCFCSSFSIDQWQKYQKDKNQN